MELKSKKMILMNDLEITIKNEGFSVACSRCRYSLQTLDFLVVTERMAKN